MSTLLTDVAVEVRAVTHDEFVDWVAALQVAFHVERLTPQQDAAFRLDVQGWDLARTTAAFDEGQLAGTMYSFAAELALPGGSALKADAITAATVLPTHRRRGLLTRLLTSDLRAARERGDTAAILIAAEYPIYGRFGFGPATEQVTYTLHTTAATFNRAGTGRVDFVEAGRMRQIAPTMFDQLRSQRPGQISRPTANWDLLVGLVDPPWVEGKRAVRNAVFVASNGQIEGYLVYRVDGTWDHRLPTGKLEIVELIALSADAYLGLWRYCAEIDLVRQVTATMRSTDEPLAWLLHNPRAALQQTMRSDLLWLRPLDVPGLLAARTYQAEGRLVLEVSDPLGLSGGRFVVQGGPQGSTCTATTQSADVTLSSQALGAIVLGGLSLKMLADAGAIEEHRPGALDEGERLFRWPVAPWCSTFF